MARIHEAQHQRVGRISMRVVGREAHGGILGIIRGGHLAPHGVGPVAYLADAVALGQQGVRQYGADVYRTGVYKHIAERRLHQTSPQVGVIVTASEDRHRQHTAGQEGKMHQFLHHTSRFRKHEAKKQEMPDMATHNRSPPHISRQSRLPIPGGRSSVSFAGKGQGRLSSRRRTAKPGQALCPVLPVS